MNILQYLDPVLTLLAPMLTDLLATGLAALMAMVLFAIRKYVGLRGEAILRDALNQAIATGVAQAPSTGKIADVAEAAVAYAKRSSPTAIKKLGATEDILLDKARAAIKALK